MTQGNVLQLSRIFEICVFNSFCSRYSLSEQWLSFFFQNTLLKLISVIKRVWANSALSRGCVPMIVTIEMATNMAAIVDKREIIYEFKSDLTIYDRNTY